MLLTNIYISNLTHRIFEMLCLCLNKLLLNEWVFSVALIILNPE